MISWAEGHPKDFRCAVAVRNSQLMKVNTVEASRHYVQVHLTFYGSDLAVASAYVPREGSSTPWQDTINLMHDVAQQNDNYIVGGDINGAGARDMQSTTGPADMMSYEHIRRRTQPTDRDINIHLAIMEIGMHAATPRSGKAGTNTCWRTGSGTHIDYSLATSKYSAKHYDRAETQEHAGFSGDHIVARLQNMTDKKKRRLFPKLQPKWHEEDCKAATKKALRLMPCGAISRLQCWPGHHCRNSGPRSWRRIVGSGPRGLSIPM